jgi:hypothetical protein
VNASAIIGSGALQLNDSPSSPEIHNGITLTELPCSTKSPQKYARKVLVNLFQEMNWLAAFIANSVPAASKSSRQSAVKFSGVSAVSSTVP